MRLDKAIGSVLRGRCAEENLRGEELDEMLAVAEGVAMIDLDVKFEICPQGHRMELVPASEALS